MARTTALIDGEIAVLEARVLESTAGSVGADGVSVSTDMAGVRARLDQLYRQRARITGESPMFVRGVVEGL